MRQARLAEQQSAGGRAHTRHLEDEDDLPRSSASKQLKRALQHCTICLMVVRAFHALDAAEL